MHARVDWAQAPAKRAPTRGRRRAGAGPPQVVALVVAGVLLAGVAVAGSAAFIWPSGPPADLTHSLGSIERFPPGTVTTLFAPTDGSSAPVSNVAYLGLAG